MKSLIIVAAMFCIFNTSASAQKSNSHGAQIQTSTSTQTEVSKLLNDYYDLKNALVNSNLALASSTSTSFSDALNGVDFKTLPLAQQNAFTSLKEKLLSDAQHLSSAKTIADQRNHFADLSMNMWELLKAFNYKEKPVYQAYCPMKKAYWLSSEKAIKNPYYSKQMLSCGKVSATL